MCSLDSNKVFGVTFGTPPDSSNGVAHILEHSVLCGGRKYPLKEPFVELLKGSMNTFLNAFTYPDRTCYPVASTNLKDFYNLIDVYLDAVFFPNITELTFKQEGWHYAPDDKDPNRLIYRGVVFNEMKGVYSQPDSLVHRHMSSAMYPNPEHVYGLDSGGDPVNIPDLTYEEFVCFHQQYYRPSNARIFFFGDDPEEERLRLIDETFSSLYDVDPQRCGNIPRPKPPIRPLNKPGLRLKVPYMIDPAESDNAEDLNAAAEEDSAASGGNHYAMCGWVLNEELLELEESIILGIANDLLVGNSSSTLYRDLMDSKLGTAFIGGGLSDELQQAIFSAGLKGVKEEDTMKIEEIIHDSLQRVVKNGFSKQAIDASVNSTEFSLLEFNTGGIPRGLSLMLASNPCWLYGDDPFLHLEMKKAMRAVRTRIDAGEPIFSNIVRKYLLHNQCRSTVELIPDEQLNHQQEQAERDRLDAVREKMNDKEFSEIKEQQRLLLKHQSTPDTAEVVNMIPRLELSDLEKTIATTPRAITNNTSNQSNSTNHNTTLLVHELAETNGIVYVDIVLDANDVNIDSLAWLPLFTSALTQTGTDSMDEASLTFQIGTDTGGIGASTMFSSVRDLNQVRKWSKENSLHKVVLRGKATVQKVGLMFDLMGDVLLGANLNNRERLTEMIHRRREEGKSVLLSSGHSVAGSRLNSKLSKVGWISEQMSGLSAYEKINAIDIDSNDGWEECTNQLHQLRSDIVHGDSVVINVTSDSVGILSAENHVSRFMERLPKRNAAPKVTDDTLGSFVWDPAAAKKGNALNEGFAVASQVNYVVQGGILNLSDSGVSLGSASVVSRYLRNTWLWDEVRVKGGAYGGFCSFDGISNVFQYGSYRDPNLQATLDAYAKSSEFLNTVQLDENEVTKGIVGTISDADTPRTPATRGYTDMMRYLVGETDDNRQAYRDEVLSTTEVDFRRFGEMLNTIDLTAVVVGGQGSLDTMKEDRNWSVKRV
jgi:Zn-dependent M16 (insulinase) family peptidase